MPLLKSRVITTAEASQVGVFHLGNDVFVSSSGRDVYIYSSARVIDGMEIAGTADESSPGSFVECVVGLSLCGIQFCLVVS